jgi:glycosyltransferase involved in cell wall biosynthesis
LGFEPTLLLSAGNPAIGRFRAQGIPVVTVRTPDLPALRNTRFVQRVKKAPGQVAGRSGPIRALWNAARSARNVLLRTLPLTWRLWRAITSAKPDLVHINDAIFLNRPAIAASWLAGRRAVCHVRSLGQLNWIDRLLARTLRGCITISRWVEGDLAAQGLRCARSVWIYDGVDPGAYEDLPDRRAARESLGLPADATVVAVLGRLVPWKGQHLFIQAMRRVIESNPLAIGVIAGAPEVYSLDYEPALREQARELGIADRIRFTGFVAEPRTVLAAVDVLAHTSVTPEPFGLVMIEAMAAGKAVVTPAEGGGAEIVVHGETGLQYRPRDPVALEEALMALVSDQDAARAMGRAGRARVQAEFDVHRFRKQVAAFYREMTA